MPMVILFGYDDISNCFLINNLYQMKKVRLSVSVLLTSHFFYIQSHSISL